MVNYISCIYTSIENFIKKSKKLKLEKNNCKKDIP